MEASAAALDLNHFTHARAALSRPHVNNVPLMCAILNASCHQSFVELKKKRGGEWLTGVPPQNWAAGPIRELPSGPQSFPSQRFPQLVQ